MQLASTLWWIRPELVLRLAERLGQPVDSYVNGAQTWFTDAPGAGSDAGAGDSHTRTDRDRDVLEWRLHPVAGFTQPAGLSHYDLWERVTELLTRGAHPDRLRLGREERSLAQLWDGLECFPAYSDELEPATVAARATDTLGIPPDARGLVDHDAIADAWEQSRGAVSIVALLAEQLHAGPDPRR